MLGNPGSGGIYPPENLPGLFRGMHRWNVPGLGTDLIKSVVYFDRKAAGWPITALAIWPRPAWERCSPRPPYVAAL